MPTLHVVSHTHWDREWYRTFQQFRFQLVGLLDGLLDLLERDPLYRFFTLDGQTIVLDDYLTIRPENEPRIRHLIEAGRLLIGPWYVLPDEFLEGPEAIIRNLLAGRRGCRRFVGMLQPMERIGYLPDPFGHISQLPQLAAGFGMDALCFWRGVADAPTEFCWAAPDGTQCLVLHLRDSYSNGAWLGLGQAAFTRDLAESRNSLLPHATTSHLLIMHGTDHMEPRADLPVRLAEAERASGERVIHSTLPDYLAAVRTQLGADGLAALALRQGEMRSPQRSHLLPAVLSARTWIKQWNARCEMLLTRWAEPFSAFAEQVTGATPQRGFLRSAWQSLLQNHPHDSICGCSVDQVHEEMRARFAASEQIAEAVTQASLESLAHYVDTSSVAGEARAGSPILVFNPSSHLRTDRVRVHLPATPVSGLEIVDPDGRRLPLHVVSRPEREHWREEMGRPAFEDWLARNAASLDPSSGAATLVRLATSASDGKGHLELLVRPAAAGVPPAPSPAGAENSVLSLLQDQNLSVFGVRVLEDSGTDVEFLARDVPPFGCATFSLRESGLEAPVDAAAPSAEEDGRIENEFFRVQADRVDGTLTITDKRSGTTLIGMNRFVDGGDRGDEYNYCPPAVDLLVDRPAAPPAIRRTDDGISSALEVQFLYRVPRGLAPDNRAARSREQVDLPITSRIRLTPGLRRIEFETTVLNGAEDHRLRVHIPTHVLSEHSDADGHFDVVRRPVSLPADTQAWREQPVGTHPQLEFVDVSDGQKGILIANQGLPEYEALAAGPTEPGVTIALTLLRCVGWLSRGDLTNRVGHAGPALPTPGAQCSGKHTFHYALIPHTGNYLTAAAEARAFTTPLRAVFTDRHRGPLPPNCRFLDISPSAVVVTSVKPAEEGPGLVIRFYNSASVPVTARARFWRVLREAHQVPLDEGGSLRLLASGTESFSLPLRPREIATVCLAFDA